jgi:hypothetical protein
MFDATAIEEVVSARPDELREHAVRPANVANSREWSFVIEIER